jgi:cytoskeletal protein CcmA (bactofilin family)
VLKQQILKLPSKTITLNKGGPTSSAGGAGIEFEENGIDTAFIKLSSTRDGFDVKFPTDNKIYNMVVKDPSGNTGLQGNFDVSGNTNIVGTLDVTGNTNIGGSLDVNNKFHVNGLNGNISTAGNMDVSGSLDTTGNFSVNTR